MTQYIFLLTKSATIIDLLLFAILVLLSMATWKQKNARLSGQNISVREWTQFGWVFFIGNSNRQLGSQGGKWECRFRNRDFADHICREAVERGYAIEAKHTNDVSGVCCFFVNGSDAEEQKHIIRFMRDNNLLRRKGDGAIYDMIFFYSQQTHLTMYAEERASDIRLSQFLNLKTGRIRDIV